MEILTVGVVNSSFSLCFDADDWKEGHQLFGGRKVHPRENPGYTYDLRVTIHVVIGGM